MSGEKERVRRRFLETRRKLGEAERAAQSEKIRMQLLHSSLFRDADKILCYAALPEEVDLTPVQRACFEAGKSIAFPITRGSEIFFYEVAEDTEFRLGNFHVPEPVLLGAETPVDWERALCLTPGVAFDGFGGRLGYGKGYYDRYFAAHPSLLRVGVCFTEQLSEALLPTDENDIPMNALLTPRGLMGCAKG